MSHFLVISITLTGIANSSCRNCNQNVELNINKQFTLSGNNIGHKEESSSFTVAGVDFGYNGTSYKTLSFTDIFGGVPPYGTRPSSEVFQKVDDYFSLAVYSKTSCSTFYHPSNRPVLDSKTCQPGSTGNNLVPSTFYTKVRLDRQLVGGTYAKKIFVGRFGVCNGFGCSYPTQTIANVYLNYNISVPQNCVINAGEIISVDFGNIPSTAFKSPGKIAEKVTPVTRQLTMQCTNIEPFRNMSVRVQANGVLGNAIVSDNVDVGFVLGDLNRRELTPNLPTSSIPFTVSDKNTASIPITIWPVSTTGKAPEEGRVNAIGFLRVDFN